MSERNSNGEVLNERVQIHDDGSMEYWRDIPGYEGYYRVSDRGRVRSLDRTRRCRWGNGYPLKGKFMKIRISQDGYLRVSLSKDCDKKEVEVHRLVMKAFIGDRPQGMECRHLDGNPQNPKLSNLQWGTDKENSADKKIHGTEKCGEERYGAKLTEQDVLAIREMWANRSHTQLQMAAMFGIGGTQIHSIVHRRKWKHV